MTKPPQTFPERVQPGNRNDRRESAFLRQTAPRNATQTSVAVALQTDNWQEVQVAVAQPHMTPDEAYGLATFVVHFRG